MPDVVTSTWTREQVLVEQTGHDEIPVLADHEVQPAVDGWWLWDLWPLRERRDGSVTPVAGGELWMALSARAEGHPGGRHDAARIALLHRTGEGEWRRLGPVFADDETPGTREWAGAAWHDDGHVVVDYTAAGVRGEEQPSFRQRMFTGEARLEVDHGTPRLVDHGPHTQLVVSDGQRYHLADETEGEAGFIKAFRDPFRFVDPADGTEVVLFTASLRESDTGWDGAVGVAEVAANGTSTLLDPLLTADGVNNELERPHLVVHEGRYLLFVSTQARTFHPDAPGGRSGLHGWVAERLGGPYRPLNGGGLIAATPQAEPFQTYSWLVLDDLTVCSFVDSHSLRGRHPAEIDVEGEHAARAHFGGTPAPRLQLWVEGERAGLAI